MAITVEELELGIKQLSHDQLKKFRQWYSDFDANSWDEQIASDSLSGKLDFLVEEAKQAKKTNTLRDI